RLGSLPHTHSTRSSTACLARSLLSSSVSYLPVSFLFFSLNVTSTTTIYTLSLHDALPIYRPPPLHRRARGPGRRDGRGSRGRSRSEEHTSELQSHLNLVCRLLLEKKKNHERNEQFQKRRRANNRHSPRPPVQSSSLRRRAA